MNAFVSCCLRFLSACYFIICLSFSAIATHDMGADLSYRCLGGNDYEFTIVFYRSCENNIGAAPAEGLLAISSPSCGYIGNGGVLSDTIPLINFLEISPICPAEQGFSQCLDINNPHPGVEEYIYQGIVTLPDNCSDWNISWDVCCRNANITNSVIDPGILGTEMRLEVSLNNLNGLCNSSPTFTNIPTPFILAGQPYWYNPGAVDIDGDSLVFELVNPLQNTDAFVFPYDSGQPVVFNPGFSATQPVFTMPPNSLEFDSQTGQLYFIPDGPQWDIMTIQVSEYRNGELIGTSMRDMQIVVRDDSLNMQPEFLPPSNVRGGAINNYTFSVCAGKQLDFDLVIQDANSADILTLTQNVGTALAGATVAVSGTNPVTLSVSWPTTDADLGNHSILLIVEDDACPIIGRQSVGYLVSVHEGVVASPQVATICPGVSNTVQLNANIGSGLGTGTFSWTPTTGLSDPTIANPVATVTDSITYTVSYQEGGCTSIDQVSLVYEGEVSILSPDPIICLGDSVQLEAAFNFTLSTAPVCGLSAATCIGSSSTFTVGTGTQATGSTNNGGGAGSPFPAFFNDARTQVLYRAGDLQAAGLTAGLITELKLDIVSKFSTEAFNGFRIQMACTPATTLADFDDTGQTVFQQNYTTALGINTFVLDTPYEWDGLSNLIITFCYNNPNTSNSGNDHVNFTNTPYNSVLFKFSNTAGEAGCNLTAPAVSTQRPNIQFTICSLIPTISYAWSPIAGLSNPNIANPMASPTATTTYALTVSTPSCTYTDTLRVNVSQPPNLNAIPTETICEGDSVQLIVSGSDIDIASFSWNPAASLNDASLQNPIAFPSSTTNYLLTATNQCGNDVASATVMVQSPPTLGINVENISCNGADDGAISVTPSGGGGSFQYTWMPAVGTGPAINNLSAGNYLLTVRDANNCIVDTTLSIVDPPILTISVQDVQNAECNGENTGEITVLGSGGTPNYEYSIDNGNTFFASNVFVNVGAGPYTLMVRDGSGCQSTVMTNVGEPDLLSLFISTQTDVDCNGASTGSVQLSGSGGTTPYEYSLDGGLTFGASDLFTGLSAQPYTAIVRDANGCISPIQVNISEPAPLSLGISAQVDVDCFDASTGSLTVFSTGGTPAYQFSIDGLNFSSSPNFIGLPAGDYTPEVVDDRGCRSSISISLSQPTEITGILLEQRDIDCNGANSGQITVTASGGNPGGYLFSLDPVNGSFGPGTFGGLTAGDYQITVSDFVGCRGGTTIDVTLTEPSPLIIGIDNQINVDCNGNNTGVMTLVGSGGVPTYEFAINPPDFSPELTFDSLSATTYTFSIRDANGCMNTIDAEILEPLPLEGNLADITPVDCNANSTGTVSVAAEGGTPAYSYSIDGNNFFNDSTFNGLAAGPYSITIRDNNGCESPVPFNITEPTPVDGVLDALVDVDCNGNNTGLISIAGRGGTPTYEYAINGNPASPVGAFPNLSAGDYILSIIDINGCVLDTTVRVNEPDPLEVLVDELIEVDCNGASTASIIALGSGGVPNYEYGIDNGPYAPLGNFSGLAAGPYVLNIRDANSCRADLPITIGEPDSLEVVLLAQTDALCNGSASGSLEVSGQGGNPLYTFALDTNNFSANTIFNNLLAGTYDISIRDDRGCVNTLAVQVGEPEPLVSVIDFQNNVDCFGNNTGEVELSTAGGTAPYSYSIGNGFITEARFSDLTSQLYEVIVRDQNNCETSVPVTISQPDELIISINARDASCAGANNGTAFAQVEGGSPAYSYEWDNNPLLNGERIENLSPGSYSVIVVDSNNCVSQSTIDINEPLPILLTSDITNESCTLANGEATISASGGTAPFDYVWNTNDTGPRLTGLAAGPYQIRVIDANNCESEIEIILEDDEAPVLSLDSLVDASCNGIADGRISVLATMGTGTYTYSWDTPSPQFTATATGLGVGTYTLTVDDGRCTSVLSAEIGQPDSLLANIADFRVPRCNGGADGEASVEVAGGTPGYTYVWNTPTPQTDSTASNLADGSYIVTVTDANNCQTTTGVIITEPIALVLNIAAEDIRCAGGSDGSALAIVSGGSPPYRYAWSDSTMDSLADSLMIGNYSITVTDFNGCSITGEVDLAEPPALNVVSVHTDLTCFQSNDGTAEVAATGGTPPYSYAWSNGPLVAQVSNLPGGEYVAEVTDANGCIDSSQIFVLEPEDILISVDSLVESFCNLPNGAVRVSASGGTPDYLYQWNTGEQGAELVGVLGEPLAGPYAVTVTDLNGCEKSREIGLKNLAPAVASFEMNVNPNEPILLSEAAIQFTNTSQNGVAYIWDFGDGEVEKEVDPFHEYLEPGTYTVSLTAFDANFSCPDDTSITFTIIVDGALFIPNAFTPNGDGYNDMFFINGEGIVSMELLIFDRWGKVVRRLLSVDDGWDGRNDRGLHVQEGVYAYLLKAVLNSGQVQDRAGTITLIR